MQTFLPYEDYYESLKTLDPSRLGNQIYREARTLVNGGWENHPASKMWRGYEYSLCEYALEGLKVLRERGRPYPHWERWFKEKQREFSNTGKPPWVGNEEFHASHRSNLLRKDKEWYSQFGWTEPDDLPYVWGTSLKSG